MAEQEHKTPGASLSERLAARSGRAQRAMVGMAVAARLGLAPVSEMSTLSIRPYLKAMARLAQARQRREDRLSAMLSRYEQRMQPTAFRRLPGFAPKATGLSALFSNSGMSSSDFVLPERGDIAPVEDAEPVEAAPAQGTRYTSSRVPRPARSAWLSTPWSPAKVARTPKVVTVAAPALPAVSARAAAPVRSRPSALQRAASRSVAVSAPGNRLARAVDAAAPQLERSTRGRALAQQLRAVADLPQAEQAVQVRRILRRAGAMTRSALAPVEAVAPQVAPTQLAADRIAPVGQRRGLRTVMSQSPGMQALVPTQAPVQADPVEAPAPRVRPAATAAARMTERQSPWLSASPVRRARAARSALSASPVAALRAAAAPAQRASQASAARVRSASSASPSTARTAAATASAAARTSGRAPRRQATAATRPASGARGADDGPGEPAPAYAGSTVETPELWAPVGVDAPDLSGGSRSATARAFQRMVAAHDAAQADAAPDAVAPGAAMQLASDGASRSRRGGFEVRRSAAGVFVPAQVLASPDAPAAPEAGDDVAATASAPAPRAANVPTPSRRAEYVQGLASTARVSRTPSSRHAAERAQVGTRPRSVMPAAPGRPAASVPASSVGAPSGGDGVARRLSLSRRADGTFVARRSTAGAPPVAGTSGPVSAATSSAATSASAASPAAGGLPVSWAAARMGAPAGRSASAFLRRSLLPSVVPALLTAAAAPSASEPNDAAADAAAASSRSAAAPAAPVARTVAPAARAAASTSRSGRAGRPSAAVQAAERASGSPLVGGAARRASRGGSGAVVHQVETRHRPSPVAYAKSFGLSSPDQVVVQTVAEPAAAGAPEQPSAASAASGRPAATVASTLQRMEARATAARVPQGGPGASVARTPGSLRFSPALSLDPVVVRFADGTATPDAADAAFAGASVSQTAAGAWTGASTATTPAGTGGGSRVVRTPTGAYVPGATAGGSLPVDWAGARTARTPGQQGSLARAVRTPRGRFDGTGTYRVPQRGAAAQRGAGAPRRARVADEFTAVRPDGFGAPAPEGDAGSTGAPVTERGSAWFTGPERPGDSRVRPSFAMTAAAAQAGLDSQGLPVWARRASGEPLIHREEQFVDALARASTPEDIVRVIYKRAEAGALSSGATGLPAPVLQVIQQIRDVADHVQAPDFGDDAVMSGPGSDLEVVRRARGETRAPAASSARVSRGSLLRGSGTAGRRNGMGSDQISKLSKKLQQLILLAEKQRSAARQEVRMAEDSAAARAEGSAAPGQAEGGNNEKVDIDALGREVLEVVTLELEMRKQRSQEGSDEFGWW